MRKASVSYDEGLMADLQDPAEAAAYLNAALEDGSRDVFLLALRDVASAHGITNIARDSRLNRENVYRILSDRGNPNLSSLDSLLRAMDLCMEIKPR